MFFLGECCTRILVYRREKDSNKIKRQKESTKKDGEEHQCQTSPYFTVFVSANYKPNDKHHCHSLIFFQLHVRCDLFLDLENALCIGCILKVLILFLTIKIHWENYPQMLIVFTLNVDLNFKNFINFLFQN